MKVLIVDNYDSFVYNIVQYVGELGGDPVVYRCNEVTLELVVKEDPKRIILSSGPSSLINKDYFKICLELLTSISKYVPTLGIGLGHQGIVLAFGGKIVKAKKVVHGRTSMISHDELSIYEGVDNPFKGARYHSLVADENSLPQCLKVTARSLDEGEVMGVRHKNYPIEGVQFHPESILTVEGKRIIKNFLHYGIRHDS